MKIAIDIGHANGTGARGNGLEEHAVATRIVDHLYTKLTEAGHEAHVIDFPEESNSDDLNNTIRAANAGGYECGISIHCDCSDNAAAHGAHVCYYPTSGKGLQLASLIASVLCPEMPGRADWTVPRSDLAALKKTAAPWVLCECGFISNEEDARKMSEHPEAIAEAIAAGIFLYLNQ